MPARAGRRFGLGARIFLLTSHLILLSVGAAVVFTTLLAGRVARQAAARTLAASSRVEAKLQQQRFDRLLDSAYLFAADSYLVAYVAEASQGGDSRSIFDLLADRRTDLGFDFAVVLDPEGRILARTDRPEAVGEDLSGRPLVSELLENSQASGLWREGGEVYSTVGVPLARGFDLTGFLVAGFRLGNEVAREVQSIGGSDVVFAVPGEGGALTAVASTLDAESTRRLLATLGKDGASDDAPLEVELGGRPWLAQGTPLTDGAGEPVGQAVVVASLDRELAPYRRIRNALLASGAVSVLLALGAAFLLARRTLGPIRHLAAAAQAAADGDYGQSIPVDRQDEVGALARAFDDLLRELRERREMEAYVSELSRNLPEDQGVERGPGEEPSTAETTLLGIELRHHARLPPGADPRSVVATLERELDQGAMAVAARGGRLEGSLGHRLWARFQGPDRSLRALAAAGDLLGAVRVSSFLADRDSAPTTVLVPPAGPAEERPSGELEPPAVVLAAGPAVSGATVVDGRSWRALVGPSVQRLESLFREAAPGEILLSREVYRELQPAFTRAGLELTERRGVTTPISLYSLPPELSARLAAAVPRTRATGARSTPAIAPTLTEIRPGQVLGARFEILATLGAGGMGVVYKARDRELEDVVALKVLRPDRWADPIGIERLKDEIKLARRITHPNVLRTYDLGTVDGVPFLSMEYVRGITLRTLLDQTDRLPYAAALRLGRQLCRGLVAVHAVGVVHRDVKPENVILEPTGNAKLMDFGIARRVRRVETGASGGGPVIGTPGYLAPEQLRGEEADHRADLYACGVVLYEVFTGELPFARGGPPMELVVKVLNEEPQPPRVHWPEMDEWLERLILTCLAKDPAHRYQAATTVLAELEALRA